MVNHHRRLLTGLCTLLLLAGLGGSPVAAATPAPAATFLTPTPGLTTVIQTGSYGVSWTIAQGTTVSATTVVIQTSRPLATGSCDIRWLPVRSAAVTGTSYQADSLLLNRCYRFLLMLTTPSGVKTVTSPVLIPAPNGLGATAQFTNPFVDGLVAYETSVRIGWAQRDTLGSTITSTILSEESAPAVGGSCAGVTWSSPVKLIVSGTSIQRSLTRSNCYRYLLTLQDARGFRSELVSGSMLIAAGLPAWTGALNFYRPSAFASQATNTWCVAASSQMMLNMILGQSDASSTSQATYIAYGQANDGGNYAAGTDPAGWAAILDRFGGSSYAVQRYADRASALKAAATRMRQTNKPVGMLVWSGRHAWVLNGFTATADPATTSDFSVTGVYVTGPLYPRAINSSGYDRPPNTLMTPTTLATYFLTYTDTTVKTWNGSYVLILP
jgi:hypothetical protein